MNTFKSSQTRFTKTPMLFRALLGAAMMLITMKCMSAGEEVDRSLAVNPEGFVSISVVRGDIKVIGWDQSEIQVKGTLDEQTKRFVFEVEGDEAQVVVELKNQNESPWGRNEGAQLKIMVPWASKIDFKGVSTDIDIELMRSDIEAGVVSGDIAVSGSGGRVDLQNVSGDIDVRDVVGRLRAGTVSGDIQSRDNVGDSGFDSVSGDIEIVNGAEAIEAESVSGDIELEARLITSASGHSVSGDIQVGGELAPGGFIDFDSVSGSVTLELSGAPSADVRMQTGSGSIENHLSADKPKKPQANSGEKIRFTLGAGEGQIRLGSRSGDLVLDSR